MAMTHRCSLAEKCKSENCSHVVPHDAPANGCDCQAPCGCWPGDREFKPSVKCVPVSDIEVLETCMHGIEISEFCQECKNLSDRDQMDREIDRAYRNGFKAGWNAAINGDEKLLAQVNNRLKG